ncbi:unnamed protein product [Symbiodinium sp. KB8]|nr:unnamed protein product [Symbiodinium sp. KB8]
MSTERFVHRDRNAQIVDVDEFQMAKALLVGEVEILSHEVDSQHLFDLCCHFGHQSTALAMLEHGVSGCVFKGPRSFQVPVFTHADYRLENFSAAGPGCNCSGWCSCKSCSWGFSAAEGFWMEDWDASLQDAKSAAESAAAKPLVRALLEAFRSQAAVDRIATAEGMAYLLDVAILIGDAELARCCAQHCTRWPLRRWRGEELVRIMEDDFPCLRAEIWEKDVLVAALAGGLELEHLNSAAWASVVSLAEAIVLSADAELWHRVQGLQLQLGPWPAHEDYNYKAEFFVECSGGQVRLSWERLHRAKKAGLALSSFRARAASCRCQRCGSSPLWFLFSLLDVAILFGQSDCARLCGPMDIEATEDTLKASLEAMPLVWEDERVCEFCVFCGCTSFQIRITDLWAESIASLPERQAAAAEALRTALQASLRRAASSAGFGLFQAMRSWARGKSVPTAVVELVLAFAANPPSLLQALQRLAAIPYLSIEVIFNGYDVYGNLLNHHPACIYYDMEIDRNSWHSLAGSDLKQQMYLGKEVAIPVGPKVSSFTADALEKNIENELKESIRMIRMRIGFESAYEDSEVRDEALRTYLGHLEKECVLDVDWAHDESDKPLKPWGAPSPFNAAEYKSLGSDAWKKHWKEKSDLRGARRYLAVKENHAVLSGVPLHFSSSDLKEIRKCIMGCKPIQEYFRYPSDDIFFFAVAKVFPLPDSVCSVWVFMGAEVKMPRERIMQLCKEQKEAEAAMFEEEEQAMEGAEEEDIEDLEAPPEVKEEAPPPPPEVKDEGQDLYASAEADKKLEQLQQGKDDSKEDEKKTKKKDKESE